MNLSQIPKTFEEWIEVYGDPRGREDRVDSDWAEQNLVFVKSPFPLKLSWDLDRSVWYLYLHKKVGEAVVDALEEIFEFSNGDVLAWDHNRYGGCFNYRAKRGSEGLSAHAWGAAIDLNPHLAPFGKKSKQPKYIVDAFESRGFVYGGKWQHPDGMHFQAGRGL